MKCLFPLLVLGFALSQSVAALVKNAQSSPRPSPWNMDALCAAPTWTRIDRPQSEGLQAITYTGVAYRGKPTRVFAWLGLPKLPPGEKAPAMVLVHGGGGTAFEDWVRLWVQRGYAAIAMDTCGQVPVGSYGKWIRDEQGGPAGWGGFDQLALPPTEQWTYHAVADAILAHSLIRSLPEVDPNRTGVTGISWGGYLTCIVAGVDNRFKFAVPVYGCGFYLETVFAKDLERIGAELADEWMTLWDPSAYLESTTLPMLWVNGSNDFAYTLGAWQRSYRLAKGPRVLCAPLRMPHGHGGAGENPQEIHVFANSVLKNEPGLARITRTGNEGTNAWIEFTSPVAIKRAELNYTCDVGAWQNRKWENAQANIREGRAEASLPASASVWYFNVFDARGCLVSSEHTERE